eukprot:CAMPEP_0168524144 /NCGR_PEP_ID=MMETSP0405-20121227/10456_1 /TAXON_ID=498012 /ORGANISM="Trichosphaerium sp, Strain Am-I-7 wt" /LENGTH=235 /DNA_ID=CAMNT_0008546257 /DNA_START=41 /DNA_END=748 /DNA_ORIENTATION=-
MDILTPLRNAADKAEVTDDQKAKINVVLKAALKDAEKNLPEAVKILEEVKAISTAKKMAWHVKLLKKKVELDKFMEAEDSRKEKTLDKIADMLTVKQRATLLIHLGEQIKENDDLAPVAAMAKAIEDVEPELKLKDKQKKKKDNFLKFITTKQNQGRARMEPLIESLKKADDKDDKKATETILGKIKDERKDMKKTRKAIMDEMKSTFEPDQSAIIMIHLMNKELEGIKVALATI